MTTPAATPTPRPKFTPLPTGGAAVRRWDHDCSSCLFMGHHGTIDVYLCSEGLSSKFHTVILRHSDEPADYWAASKLKATPAPAPTLASTLRERLRTLCQRVMLTFTEWRSASS